MSISTTQYTVGTSHGSLAVEEHGKGGTPVLLIHGNSSCRGVFQHQLHGQLAENYRFIAFDLPGHGQSSDAPDPARTYTRPGLVVRGLGSLASVQLMSRITKRGWSMRRTMSWIGPLMFVWLLVRILALFKR